MAIDPVTGIDDGLDDESTALGGATDQGGGVSVAITNSEGDGRELPNYGGDQVAALSGTVQNLQTQAQQQNTALNSALPGYNAPDQEKLDTIKDHSEYMTPEMMVSNQLSQIIESDSPYMQAITGMAEREAQRYGQLGSAQAVGQATRYGILEAKDIARDDAATHRTFGQQRQASENEIGKIAAETELGSALMSQRHALENTSKTLAHTFQLAAQQLDFEGQAGLADIQGKWQTYTQEASMMLDAELQGQLLSQKIDAETVASVKKQTGDMVQNYQISVEQLLKDPDFLQLGGSAISSTLNNMLNSTVAGMQFMADSSGINIDAYLDAFIENASMDLTDIPEPD